MKRNITVQIDEATLHKARVAAAQRGSSVSRLLAEQIEVLARQDLDYDRAMQDALAELDVMAGTRLDAEMVRCWNSVMSYR